MQLPEFITAAFPMLKETHALASDLKKTLGEFKAAQQKIEALEAELTDLKVAQIAATESALKLKAQHATIEAALSAEVVSLKAERDLALKAAADLRANPSKQAAELLATRVGVKLEDAPKADATTKVDARRKSGLDAYREKVAVDIAAL